MGRWYSILYRQKSSYKYFIMLRRATSDKYFLTFSHSLWWGQKLLQTPKCRNVRQMPLSQNPRRGIAKSGFQYTASHGAYISSMVIWALLGFVWSKMARWHNLHTLYQPWFYGACTYIGLIFISICGGAPFVRTEKVRTGKCQNKKQEKVRTDFVLIVLVPK